MICPSFNEYTIFPLEELEKMKTRQLLSLLRNTYSMGCSHCWTSDDWTGLRIYQNQIKTILSTREHIPNKLESKALRKLRKKEGK